MAQNQIPLDPIQAQLVKTAQTGTASTTSGPAYTQNVFGTRSPAGTGLVEGLKAFGQALGSAADVAKKRKFAEDMITAGLYAAKEQVAPGLTSQKALIHNYNLLDENYANRILNQVEVYNNNVAANISNHLGQTTEQKAMQHSDFIEKIRGEAIRNITHNGEALATLNTKLEGYKHKWNVDIAQFELASRMQNTMEAVSSSIKNQFSETSYITKPYIKTLVDKLQLSEIKHERIKVGGKWLRTELNIDNNKAVFSLLKNNVVDKYRQNPRLYRELKDRIADYFKPLSDKEQALITAGKQDAIGDHQTFKSLFSELDSEITALQKTQTEEHKNSLADWYLDWATKKLDGNLPWEPQDTELFIQQFGIKDASTYINKAQVLLKTDRYGFDTMQSVTALGMVSRGEIRTQEDVHKIVQTFHLSKEVGAKLNGLIGEHKTEYKDNVSMLEKSSVTSTGRIEKLLRNTHFQNIIAPILKDKNRTLQDLLSKDYLEGWLLIVNKIKWPSELKFVYDNLKREVALNQTEIYKASRDRVYDETLRTKYNSRTFTPKEAGDWAVARTTTLLESIEDLAEWQVVLEKQSNNKWEYRLVRKGK